MVISGASSSEKKTRSTPIYLLTYFSSMHAILYKYWFKNVWNVPGTRQKPHRQSCHLVWCYSNAPTASGSILEHFRFQPRELLLKAFPVLIPEPIHEPRCYFLIQSVLLVCREVYMSVINYYTYSALGKTCGKIKFS